MRPHSTRRTSHHPLTVLATLQSDSLSIPLAFIPQTHSEHTTHHECNTALPHLPHRRRCCHLPFLTLPIIRTVGAMTSVSHSPSSSSSSSSSSTSSSSSATPTAAASHSSFATLFHSLPATAICTFLHTTDVLSVAPWKRYTELLRLRDLLSLASVDRATRRRLLSSPAVWRARVFASVAPPSSAPISAALPSWCLAVQLVRTEGVETRKPIPEGWCVEFAHLARYPNLRRIHATWRLITHYGNAAAPITLSPSLSSMRHLTRISLDDSGKLSVDDMRLLATLPVLASFAVRMTDFASGNEQTLRQWQALAASRQSRRSAKGDVGQLGEEEEGKEDGKRAEVEEESKCEAEDDDAEEKDNDEYGEPMGRN